MYLLFFTVQIRIFDLHKFIEVKIKLLLLILFLSFSKAGESQTIAQDWTKDDCNGVSHNLFSELDSGYVIMLEFVMQCGTCIAAAADLNTIYNDFEISNPGRLKYYMIDYSSGFSCDTMTAWAHGINCTFFLDGSHEVAYYGGFGMPTIVILGGVNHSVFYNSLGFNPTFDIQYIRDAIDLALVTSGVPENAAIHSLSFFPNPAGENVRINYSLTKSSDVRMVVLDVSGRIVLSLSLGNNSAGENSFQLETSMLSKGFYTLRFLSEESSTSLKFVVSK